MRTFPVVETDQREAGLSLFELLVVLAILSLMTSFSAALMFNAFPERRVTDFVSTLENDLHAARLHVRRTGQVVQLELDVDGYVFSELGREQVWPEDVQVSWRESEAGWHNFPSTFQLSSSRLGWRGFQVRVETEDHFHDVIQNPISGRIDRISGRVDDE